jgi:hypothetical protein
LKLHVPSQIKKKHKIIEKKIEWYPTSESMGTGASCPVDADANPWLDEETVKQLAGDKWSKAVFDEAAEDGKLAKGQWEALVLQNEASATQAGDVPASQVKRPRRQRKKPGLTLGCSDAVDHNVRYRPTS